jgi:hypothetical protein
MNEIEFLTTFLNILLKIKDKKKKHGGICSLIINYMVIDQVETTNINKVLRHLFKQWPKFSGDEHCPVPHLTAKPASAFRFYKRWADDTYGNNRRELLDFMIGYVERELKTARSKHI